MTFPAYPEYKDSGVEWLGDVPTHWQVIKLSYIATSKGGGTPPKDDLQYWNGNIPWVTPKDMKRQWITSTIDTLSEEALRASSASMIEPDHVLMVFRSGILRHRIPVAINKLHVTVNQDLRAYYVKPRLLSEYFLNLVQGLNREFLFEWSKQGATVESLDSELVNATQLPIPPKAEQQAISAFLNHETARIDALVEEQQRLIELLKEKRQAVISHAVTKGLDPDVPMKDSGVEWLGEVPAHWDLLGSKRFLRLVSEPAPKGNSLELLSVYTEIGVRPRKELEQKGNKASTTDGYWLVKKGDIIVNKLLAWMGAVGFSAYEGVTSPAYDILRPTRPMDSKFYHYLFRSRRAQQEFKRWSRGIMEMRLRCKRSFRTVLPQARLAE